MSGVSPTAGQANVLTNIIDDSLDIGEYVSFDHGVMLVTGTHDFTLTDRGDRKTGEPRAGISLSNGSQIARAVIIGP